jgi:deoxycytidylate deaminase
MLTNKIPFPYLPADREIFFTPETNLAMIEAKKVRDTKSTDFKNPTGAIVYKDGIILGEAANQSLLKRQSLINLHSKWCIRRILRIPSGKGYFLCPGCASFHQHAETRATIDAHKKHGDISGADLYLYGHWWCCKPCWDTMIKYGIKNVYLVENAYELFKRK